MKKTFKILAIITAIVALFAITAFAADFEHCAGALSELGLFRGTQNGYELDRAPNRAEAATMLVRLLGAEEEALALTYTAPYTDVADWAKPYVQYLHNKGLTKGTSATTFGYSDKCTAQQYATFLLRALGYTDGESGDFTYIKAMEFAEDKGVLDGANYIDEKAFLRDNVVAMSYSALYCAPKSGEADLLTKLIADGAIDAGAAEKAKTSFALIREVKKALAPINEATKMSADMMITDIFDTQTSVQKLAVATETNIESMDKSKFSYKGTLEQTTAEGKNSFPVEYYYADGYMYFNLADMKEKTAMSFEEALTARGMAYATKTDSPVSMIESIGKDGDTYKIRISTDAISYVFPDGNISDYEYGVTVEGEKVTDIEFKTSQTVKLFEPEEEINSAFDISFTNIKLGDGVSVTLPSDLDTYTELTGELLG